MIDFARIDLLVKSLEIYHPKQVQYDEYNGDNDQGVDPTACLRESWTYVPTEKAEQPKYYQNYDNRPQHEISPLNDLLVATWPIDRVVVDLTVRPYDPVRR